MKFIVGTKERMTQVFNEDGEVMAATILRVSPATITQVKGTEKDGYDAVQIATVPQKESRVAKAQRGIEGGAAKFMKEFRPRTNFDENIEGMEVGQTMDASVFEPGDQIVVSAVSKGKGFQGVVKRYNFGGGPGSHGQKHTLRAPGSIGIGGIQRVQKGTRMAGRMGSDRVSVKNLKVLQVNTEDNVLVVSGAVPGRKGTLVEVRSI
ncbi:50S ribosomal protein L3 [Candidatus Kaiserbacteria bacterium]|nr:50S ribosomal protein L3 [Candidatus Kaiserbacteria bacterium]